MKKKSRKKLCLPNVFSQYLTEIPRACENADLDFNLRGKRYKTDNTRNQFSLKVNKVRTDHHHEVRRNGIDFDPSPNLSDLCSV